MFTRCVGRNTAVHMLLQLMCVTNESSFVFPSPALKHLDTRLHRADTQTLAGVSVV